ncbi:hypothetical protein [Heliophilum fasciatum]|uniref:Uncharacterized protein n=1 Tax=Heliophilum fasciatum TaxID=35700 RepID=A0A4R2RNX9_9FIRM|nr:hypothetical protein [Heliophilum fasciatum]MCW2277971.1 hypothetical protein [Heliophilum fasciatum]TCP64409.1 hypothetical protein EDD73_110108 [Heliophilum fasciatum]
MNIIPMNRFVAKAAPFRLQGVLSLVLVWEGRRTGTRAILCHYVEANPEESQLDWVGEAPFGQGRILLSGLEDYTVDLTYQEAFALFDPLLSKLRFIEDEEVYEQVTAYWKTLERPAPLDEKARIALMYRLFDRELGPREVVHTYYQAWAVEDWGLAYLVVAQKTRDKYGNYEDFRDQMESKYEGESLLRGVVVDEQPSSNGVNVTADALIGKDQTMIAYQARFHLVREDERWVITSIRRANKRMLSPEESPFFHGPWYWRVFPGKGSERAMEQLQDQEGMHIEEGEKGSAIVYVESVQEPNGTKYGIR